MPLRADSAITTPASAYSAKFSSLTTQSVAANANLAFICLAIVVRTRPGRCYLVAKAVCCQYLYEAVRHFNSETLRSVPG